MSLLRGPFCHSLLHEAWNATSPTRCGWTAATQASLAGGLMLTTMSGKKHAMVSVSMHRSLRIALPKGLVTANSAD